MRSSRLPIAFLFFSRALAGLYGESNLNHSCVLVEPLLSCSKGALPNLTDSCCVETFGGLVLATQFWNTYSGLESQGQVLPEDSWTVHGLWPDFCNGSYTQYCDLSRQFDPLPSPNTTTGKPDGTPVPPWKGAGVGTFLEAFGKLDLLAWMNKYWIAQGQPNQDLWGHEFSKHGTCFSTFDIECYGPKYVPNQEVITYFSTAAAYFLTHPTWSWLSASSIRPSNTTSYSLSAIQAALRAGSGALPYVGCSGPRYNATAAGKGSADNGFTVLSEVWYYQHVYGRVEVRQGVAVDASIGGGSVSNCAKAEGGVWYYERARGSEVSS